MNGMRSIIVLAIKVVATLQTAVSVAGSVNCDRIFNCNSSVISGQISSPRYPLPYPTNISYNWIIRSPPKTYISLLINKISIRLMPYCIDHLTVRYAGPVSYKYCYSWYVSSNLAFYSPNNEMNVTFTAGTGNNTEQQGFLAKFKILKAVCPKENLTSMSGILMSPNYYHSYYPGNLTCQWVIQVPQGYRILLTFSTVKLQNTNRCESDYILVMDGVGSSAHLMERICHERYVVHYYSSGNAMTVRFVSDLVFTNRGFYASYSATSPTPISTIMSSTAIVSGLPTYTVSPTPTLTPRQTLVVSPSKTTNVVPKQTPVPDFLPDYLVGTYQGLHGVPIQNYSFINRLKMKSKIACVLKCQQTLGCKAATFSYHGDDRGVCTMHDSSLQYKPEKNQQISGNMYYEQVRFHI